MKGLGFVGLEGGRKGSEGEPGGSVGEGGAGPRRADGRIMWEGLGDRLLLLRTTFGRDGALVPSCFNNSAVS